MKKENRHYLNDIESENFLLLILLHRVFHILYLYMKKLYSTIGVLGYYEAAKFLGLEDGTDDYNEFMQLILGTIAEENKKHSIYDKKRPFVFNQECIPGENLAVKLYN